MAFTLQQREALEAAIAKGVLTVKYDGRERTYQSTSAMITALRFIDEEIAAADTSSGGSGPVFATYTRA